MDHTNMLPWTIEDEQSSSFSNTSTSNDTLASGPGAAEKYVILAVCVLSGLGSLMIISSWILFKSIRSRSRHILVCLSVADLGVAISNGTGLLASHQSDVCRWQAAGATFFGASCLLWTIALAFYLYTAVVRQWKVIKNFSVMVVFYAICWGIPLVVTCVLLATNKLGGDPSRMTDWEGWWCVLKSRKHPIATELTVYIFLISELWAYIAYIIVPILYFLTRRHIHRETQSGEQFVTSGSLHAVQAVDRKLALLPMVFILLHIWSSIMTARTLYYMYSTDTDPRVDRQRAWFKALHFLEGVGDSAQGLCNGLLFVGFTKKVRAQYIRMLCGLRRRSEPAADVQSPLPHQQQFYRPTSSGNASPQHTNDSGIGEVHSLNSSDTERTPLLNGK